MSTETRWFVGVAGGEPVGPVSADQVRRGVAAGKIPADAVVCAEGTSEWVPMKSAFGSAAPAPSSAAGVAPRSNRTLIIAVLAGACLLLVLAVAVIGVRWALAPTLPAWAPPLGAAHFDFAALSSKSTEAEVNDGIFKVVGVDVNTSPPSVLAVSSKSGKDWTSWVRIEMLVEPRGRSYEERMTGKCWDAASVERPLSWEGENKLPSEGAKAKLVLLVPNVPDINRMAFDIGYEGTMTLAYDPGSKMWSLVSTPEQAKLSQLLSSMGQRAQMAKELKPCCDALAALPKKSDSDGKPMTGALLATKMCLDWGLKLSHNQSPGEYRTVSEMKAAIGRLITRMDSVEPPAACK